MNYILRKRWKNISKESQKNGSITKHYENTPIQIYTKFYIKKMKIFREKKKTLIFFIFLHKGVKIYRYVFEMTQLFSVTNRLQNGVVLIYLSERADKTRRREYKCPEIQTPCVSKLAKLLIVS